MGISSISANVMGISSISAASQMECNDPLFRDCFDNAGKLVTWISRKQKPDSKSFARFEMIAQPLETKRSVAVVNAEECGEKGFESRYSMTERVMHHKKVCKDLAKNELLLT